jgi:hypothetical protein
MFKERVEKWGSKKGPSLNKRFAEKEARYEEIILDFNNDRIGIPSG